MPDPTSPGWHFSGTPGAFKIECIRDGPREAGQGLPMSWQKMRKPSLDLQ
jgi:hypothetical protein